MSSSAACECGAQEQTVDHVFLQCPIHRPPHGAHDLTVRPASRGGNRANVPPPRNFQKHILRYNILLQSVCHPEKYQLVAAMLTVLEYSCPVPARRSSAAKQWIERTGLHDEGPGNIFSWFVAAQ